MAFPGTFNISYYKGDTYEFNVYPKDSSGNPFLLTGYSSAIFTMAQSRGAAGAETQITGYAEISVDQTHVKCAITPQNAAEMDDTKQYVYDVQVARDAEPYDLVYTILTGNISITKEVTLVTPDALLLSNAPENFILAEFPSGTISGSWDPPSAGPEPTGYNIYGKVPALGVNDYVLLTPSPSPLTVFSANEFGGFPLATGVEYFIKVTSVNENGENTTEFAEASITLSGEES
jgi:hypothetical protein